jgi:hypothetical protein
LSAKGRGNIHDKGVIEIIASSVFGTNYPRNAADLDDFVKFCFPAVSAFPFTWATFHGVISYPVYTNAGNREKMQK